jgi:DNA-binding NtrC family response regulator
MRRAIVRPVARDFENEAMLTMDADVASAAGCGVPVLITASTRRARALYAHAIHAASARSGEPFVMIRTSDLTRPFDVGAAGTVFLDRIETMDAGAQVALFSLLQQRAAGVAAEAQPRMLTGASRGLPALVAAGRFREDLFYRLNLIRIVIRRSREPQRRRSH